MADAEKQQAKTKHKYFADQFDDEDVLLVFRKHPVVMRKGLVIGSLGMLVGPVYTIILTIVYAHNPDKYPTINFFLISVLLSLILGGILFFPSWIAWYYSVFIVTNQRFIQITQKGLFHTSFADLKLEQIQQVNYEISGLQETLLGFGTIKLQTYIGDLVIHDVHHPAKTQSRIVRILRDQDVTPFPAPFKREVVEQVNE